MGVFINHNNALSLQLETVKRLTKYPVQYTIYNINIITYTYTEY